MFLYLISRPDIANAARDLTKVMDGTYKAAFLELHWVIKCVSNTKNLEGQAKQRWKRNMEYFMLHCK